MKHRIFAGGYFKYLPEFLGQVITLADFRISVIGGFGIWAVAFLVEKSIPERWLIAYGVLAVIEAAYGVYRRERLWGDIRDSALYVGAWFNDPEKGFLAPAHHLISFEGDFRFTANATGDAPVRTQFLSVLIEAVERRRPWWWFRERERRRLLATALVQILDPDPSQQVALVPAGEPWVVSHAVASWQHTDMMGIRFDGNLEATLEISTMTPLFGDYRARITPATGSLVQGALS